MDRSFTPAAGRPVFTPLYDHAVRLLTRERNWRSLLLAQVSPRAGERIVDVGCGTGTFAIMMKTKSPDSRMVGVDPDPAVLERAAGKAARAGVRIEWRQGFASDVGRFPDIFDKAVSSLLFHQVPLAEKEAGIAAMLSRVRPGGEIHIADYAAQPGWLMRQLFRIVQRLDGRENTQANADGAIERILSGHCGRLVRPTAVIGTPTGAISLFRLEVAAAPPRGAPA